MSKQVLIIVHQEQSVPGRVGELLTGMGYGLDIRRPCLGHPLPTTMAGHAGAVMFGGPMSANDCHMDFIRAELDWFEMVLREEAPFLGICLGAQMLARVLGARVGPHPDGWQEIGYYKLYATPAGADMFPAEQHFYQWHGEGFDLPEGAELLVRGELFENQAFRYGANAYGVQFHPDVTREMMHRWTRKPAHRMVLPGAQSRDTQLAGNLRHGEAVDIWARRFLADWIAPKQAAVAAE